MSRERGSVTTWVAGVVMLATVLALVVARTAAVGAARGRAQAVADLAALAAVEGGRPAAAAVAHRNGAALVAVGFVGGRADVTVRRDGVRASASGAWGEMPASEGQPIDSPRGVQPP
jgi:hypothetical protein